MNSRSASRPSCLISRRACAPRGRRRAAWARAEPARRGTPRERRERHRLLPRRLRRADEAEQARLRTEAEQARLSLPRALRGALRRGRGKGWRGGATCPLSTGGATRRVHLVRGERRDVST